MRKTTKTDMITTVEIWHEGWAQVALVEYGVRYQRPYIIQVKIGLEDVTDTIDRQARKTIKKAITADSIRRQTV